MVNKEGLTLRVSSDRLGITASTQADIDAFFVTYGDLLSANGGPITGLEVMAFRPAARIDTIIRIGEEEWGLTNSSIHGRTGGEGYNKLDQIQDLRTQYFNIMVDLIST